MEPDLRWKGGGSLAGSRVVASSSGECVSFMAKRSWVGEQEEQWRDWREVGSRVALSGIWNYYLIGTESRPYCRGILICMPSREALASNI